MSVTILEGLQNADHNLQNNGMIGLIVAKDQLHNATELLLKGYPLDQDVEPLLEKHGGIDNVPDKPQAKGEG